MMDNYVIYHLHTEDSLADSCTNHRLYTDKAAELGMKAICFTEHSNIYNWVEKKMYANSKGLKYLHGCEVYLTEKLFWHSEEEGDFKKRDNYHTILIAKNADGIRELNSLIDMSTRPDHFYYKPRISFDEFFNISSNIIKISACLASPLWKYPKVDGSTRETFDKLLTAYDYYEIQPHVNSYDQKDYNLFLLEASKQYNKPLIAGTDTHSIDEYKAECRSMLMKAKKIQFSDEDELDLTLKSLDGLKDMFKRQCVLPDDVYLKAINETNVMADMCEDPDLDITFKYPVLYEDEDSVFEQRVYRMYQEKLDKGIISDDPRYLENIKEELRVFRKIGMIGFMLFMSELVEWCWDNGIPVGFSRGSVGGSTIAFISGITDTDPVKWNLVFSRFANEDRKEIGDIDIDISPSQRHLVYKHIIEKFGKDKTAYVLAITTISDKGTIDEICRALDIPIPETKEIKREYSEITDKISALKDQIKEYEGREVPQKLSIALDNAKAELETFKKETYPNVFYYFDGMVGTAIAQSMHPAGIIVSPVTLPDNYGTFWSSDGKRILSINMEEIHEVSLVKYDLLGLKNVEIIKDTCELAGIQYPKSYEIDWNDKDVWDHICDSPVGLFQFEGDFAFESMKRFKCRSVADISLVTAAIRPSGGSYRDKLLQHIKNHNPSKIIDDLLSENLMYLVYQEDTIMFLKDICGLSGSNADNIRRAIGRKDKERLEKALPEILEGYCAKSDKPRDVAEKEAKAFIKIIEDSSRYQFGKNHSFAYSMITYVCAYLRYHYPKEFITAYLNNSNNDDDTLMGTILAQQYGIAIHPIQFRHSLSRYSCDNGGIYKGVSSVKWLNAVCAEALYTFKDNQYDSFVDLLIDISKLPTEKRVDSRQLNILIELDFFSEFGEIEDLKKCNDLFTAYYGRKQLHKDKAFDAKIDYDLLRKYSKKETPKMFTGLDSVGLVKQLVSQTPHIETTLNQKVRYQLENLGYVDIVNKSYYGLCVVTEIELEHTPKITLYPLANGKTFLVKIPKKIYTDNPLSKGEIIHVFKDGCYKKPKFRKVNGEWIKDNAEKEWWIDKYEIVRDIE